MAEVENKLADLTEEERRLRDETERGAEARARSQAQRQMKDKMEALQKRTREKVQKLKKQLDALDPMSLCGYDQEELGRIKKRVDDTEKALGEDDVDEARGMAKQAHEGLRQMAMDLHDEEMRSWTRTPPKLRKSREEVSQDEMLAREIADELDKAMPKPSQLMSPEDQKRMSELAKRQQALRQRAQDMAKELGKPKLGPDGKPVPTPVPQSLQPGLREAGQHMERAEDDLRGQAPRDAVGEEAQALDKLNQMKEQMQRERRPKDQSMGARMDKEPVRIPGADEFRAPKEFRQDLLDAMKRGAPAEYQRAAQALLRGAGEMRRVLLVLLTISAAFGALSGVARAASTEKMLRARRGAAHRRGRARARASVARATARSGGRVRRRRSGDASRRVRARRRPLRRGDEAARPPRRRGQAAARSGARHRRDDQGLRVAARQALRGVAQAGQGRSARALRARDAGESDGRAGRRSRLASERAGARRDLSRGRRSGARVDADAQGDRDVGDDRAVQVQPADDRVAARARRRLSRGSTRSITSTRTTSSRAFRATRCRSGCTRASPSSRSGAGAARRAEG